MIKKLVKYLTEKQKTLFLIDSIGAFMTAIFLFVMMRQFNEYVGMPKEELTYLSIVAVSFCAYSAACFFFLKESWILFIRVIGIANLLYCALTIGLLIKYYSLLTSIGVTYFLVEIMLICVLSYVELNVVMIDQEI